MHDCGNNGECLDVTYFHRKRDENSHFSIESIFDRLRINLGNKVNAKVIIAPHLSRGFARRFANVIAAKNVQGVINHVTGDINYLALGLHGRRTVLTIHDCSFLHRSAGIRKWVYNLLWIQLPIFKSRVVVTDSNNARNELVHYSRCKPDKIRVIPVAISPSFVPSPARPFPATPRILQVGTAFNKNLERLAIALRGLPCELMIVGKLAAAQANALEENGIHYTNGTDLTQDQIIEQYKLADIIAFGSTVEGFGMPILEGQAVGRPVVTSNVSSMPEVAGNAACLVDPFDPQSIRDGFLRVIHDREYRLGLIEKGFKNVQRFDEQAIADQYFALYEEIAHDPKLRRSIKI